MKRIRGPVSFGAHLLVAAGLGVVIAGSAHALVLADKTDEAKFRADVGKQTAGYLACIIKAAQNCEKTGSQPGPECNLVTKTSTADPKGKFAPALDKCASKVNLAKKAKALTYEDIGCPGDCDPNTAGPQRCANLQAYQDFTLGDTGTRATVNLQGAVIPGLTGCSDSKSCVEQAKIVGKYVVGLLKCIGKCEGDYKNKKGNGGPTDSPVCHVPVGTPADPGGSDPAFTGCIGKVLASAEKKGPLNTTLKDAVNGALNAAVDSTYNIPGGNCGP